MSNPAPAPDQPMVRDVSPGAIPVKRRPLRLSLRRCLGATALAALLGVCLTLGGPHVRALYHLRAARREVERYHTPQAIRHLQACLRVWPESPEVLLLAARAARRARAYAEAERCLEKYQQARGLDEAGALEQILLSAERTGADPVHDLCRRYVEQGHPDTALILEALARGYLRQYRLGEARGCIDRWLRYQPDDAQALCLQGQLHLDYERARPAAIDRYRRAVELDPDHEEARLGLAVALLEANAFSESAGHLEILRQCQPDNLRIQVGLAECRQGLGDRDAAVRLVQHILTLRPDYAPALSLRARLALSGGELTARERLAIEGWLRQALRVDPRDQVARLNLIRCLQLDGKEGEARELLKEHVQRDADQKRFHDITTRELGLRPHDPALHCTMGQLLLRSGYPEEGLRWLQSALRLDPDHAPARQALAQYQQDAATRK